MSWLASTCARRRRPGARFADCFRMAGDGAAPPLIVERVD